jgi:hypothetical protein
MKRPVRWLAIPAALSALFALTPAAQSNPVQTPLATPVTVTGSSGGSQSSQCGFISGSPTQVVVVSQPTSLRFKLQGQGQPTLLIQGPVNRCVMADQFSGGVIEVPGVWEQGTYSVFVGDRTQTSHPYTLSITQIN